MTSSKVRMVTVDERSEGQRIDNFLLRELKGVPRTLIYKILRKGEVRVNKGRIKPTFKLSIGDIVRVPPVRTGEQHTPANLSSSQIERIEKTISYEDDLILIINKPSGLAVHGGSGISFGVIELLRQSRPDMNMLELAHRLDRDTSGCLMVAKKRSALRTLQAAQQKGTIKKKYLALLKGRWRKGVVEVKMPLKKNVVKSGERVVKVDPEGKPAHTIFTVRQRFQNATLVEAELKSGRTHQIRVHAQYLDSPILGDDKYGDDEANQEYRKKGLKRLFLHAETLTIPWPERKRPYQFKAPLPDDLAALLEKEQ